MFSLKSTLERAGSPKDNSAADFTLSPMSPLSVSSPSATVAQSSTGRFNSDQTNWENAHVRKGSDQSTDSRTLASPAAPCHRYHHSHGKIQFSTDVLQQHSPLTSYALPSPTQPYVSQTSFAAPSLPNSRSRSSSPTQTGDSPLFSRSSEHGLGIPPHEHCSPCKPTWEDMRKQDMTDRARSNDEDHSIRGAGRKLVTVDAWQQANDWQVPQAWETSPSPRQSPTPFSEQRLSRSLSQRGSGSSVFQSLGAGTQVVSLQFPSEKEEV